MELKTAVSLYMTLVLFITGPFLVATHSDNESCIAFRRQEEECGKYTYKAIKPMLEYFHQMIREIDINDNKIKSKYIEIADLQVKLDNFQLSRNKCNEKLADSYAACIKDLRSEIDIYQLSKNLIFSVENEIKQLAETTVQEIPVNSVNTKDQETQITELNSHIDADSEKLLKNENLLNKAKAFYEARLAEKDEIIAKLNMQAENDHNNLMRVQIEYENRCADKFKKKDDELPSSCISYKDFPGIHVIKTQGILPFDVLCDSQTAGPGWTVIQQRINGEEDFYRDWATYREGFGSFNGDFFLGLEKIYRLTSAQPHELYIHMTKFDGRIEYARYNKFAIRGEKYEYQLATLGTFSGNSTNKMSRKKFSTFDHDNDYSNKHCAIDRHGGWWYNVYCESSNLNGKYFNHEVVNEKSIFWNGWTSLKKVKILIRPKVDLRYKLIYN